MKKLIFILLGFLVLISALGAASLWMAPDSSNIETLISSTNKKPAGENQYQEFASSDAKFKIDFPSHWMAIKEEGLLQALAPQEWVEKYDLKVLFLAQNFQGGEFVQMVVYKGVFEIPIEEIFEEMKKTNENNGWTVEVLELEAYANEGIFEGKYKNRTGSFLHSKEKILIGRERGYLISLFALEKDWPGLRDTIDKILNSAKI